MERNFSKGARCGRPRNPFRQDARDRDPRRRDRPRGGSLRATHRGGHRCADRMGRAGSRRRGIQAAALPSGVPRPRRSSRSRRPASCSRARSRRRSGSARRAPTSRSASCSRPTRTSGPSAELPGVPTPLQRARASIIDHRPRERRGPVRRHRAHADARTWRSALKVICRKGCEKIVRYRLRARPSPRGARKVTLRHQGQHHEAHRGPASSGSFEDIAAEYPEHRVDAHHRRQRARTSWSSTPSQFDVDRDHEPERRHPSATWRQALVGGLGFAPSGEHTATTSRSSRRSTARRRSTPARTSSTRPRWSSASLMMLRHLHEFGRRRPDRTRGARDHGIGRADR